MATKRKRKAEADDEAYAAQVSLRITQATLDKLTELERRVGPISTRVQLTRVALDRGLDELLKDYPARSTGR